jgi:hypothetical protein
VQIQVWPLITSVVQYAAQPVTVLIGPCLGGSIQNPATAREPLFIDMTGAPAVPQETATCFPLLPGYTLPVPANFTGTVSVTSASAGHSFAGMVLQAASVATRSGAFNAGLTFPPAGPVTLQNTVRSYLYAQYSDDDDLQAFVNAYNTLTQQYALWMSNINLAVYTSDNIQNSLLDWVAEGLYGMKRGALSTGHSKTVGPLNTYAFNTLVLNKLLTIPPSDYQMMSDDIFKRVLTWHLYKGDGKVFDIRWLKRRIMRFLTGEDGTAGETDETYPVSVSFGVGNQVTISLGGNRRRMTRGAMFGTFLMNSVPLNDFESTATVLPMPPNAPIFKAAVDCGVLELPFQFAFEVNIGT